MTVISKLHIENVKRVLNVTIEPESGSPLVVIGGTNGNGKSSVLDSIAYLFAGEKSIPEKPIRSGAKSATIEADLTPNQDGVSLTLRRKFTSSGSTLEVFEKSVNGQRKLQSPQAVLSALFSRVAFDPEAFRSMKLPEQVECLRMVSGLDTSEIDAKIKEQIETRKILNRRKTESQAKANGLPFHPDAPEKEISTEALERQMAAAWEFEKKRASLLREIDGHKDGLRSANKAIEELEAKLAERRAFVAAATEKIEKAKQSLDSLVVCTFDAKDLKAANDQNEKYRANAVKAAAIAEAERAKADHEQSEREIEELRIQREKIVASASWPVEGLSIESDCVTYKGVPFAQLSSAEQIRIATTIGFASNPGLRVCLIRHGSLLDHQSLQIVSDVAVEYSGQVFVERVSEGSECTVVMHDGAIREGEPS